MTIRLATWLKFNAVGIAGVCVQLAVLAILKSLLGVHYLVATFLGVEAAILHNFIWHERWTWAHRGLGWAGAVRRLLRFNAANGAISLAGNLVLMWVLVSRLHVNYLAANVVAVAACSILNFVISDKLIFRPSS